MRTVRNLRLQVHTIVPVREQVLTVMYVYACLSKYIRFLKYGHKYGHVCLCVSVQVHTATKVRSCVSIQMHTVILMCTHVRKVMEQSMP